MGREAILARLRAAAAVARPAVHASAGMRAESLVDDPLALLVRRMAEQAGRQRVVACDSADALRLALADALAGVPAGDVLWDDQRPCATATPEVGVARAVAALAWSGTVVLAPSSPAASAASLVVRRSVILVARETIFDDLIAFSASPIAQARDRMLIFVSGASRTADIEKTLVSPAHGPAELIVFVAAKAMVDEVARP